MVVRTGDTGLCVIVVARIEVLSSVHMGVLCLSLAFHKRGLWLLCVHFRHGWTPGVLLLAHSMDVPAACCLPVWGVFWVIVGVSSLVPLLLSSIRCTFMVWAWRHKLVC